MMWISLIYVGVWLDSGLSAIMVTRGAYSSCYSPHPHLHPQALAGIASHQVHTHIMSIRSNQQQPACSYHMLSFKQLSNQPRARPLPHSQPPTLKRNGSLRAICCVDFTLTFIIVAAGKKFYQSQVSSECSMIHLPSVPHPTTFIPRTHPWWRKGLDKGPG